MVSRNVLNKAFIKYRSQQSLGGSKDTIVVEPSIVSFVEASTGSLLSD